MKEPTEPLCAHCQKPITGPGVTFYLPGAIYRMCDFVCAGAIAGKLNDAALEATAPRRFGLPDPNDAAAKAGRGE